MHAWKLCAAAFLILAAGCVAPSNPPATSTPPPSEPSSEEIRVCAPVEPVNVNSGVQTGPSAQVSSQPGAFSYSWSGASTASKTGYVWENPAPTSRWSGSLQGAGSMKVEVFDACGEAVATKTLTTGSQQASEALPEGREGTWTVQLTYDAFSGSVQLSLTS